MTTAVEKIQIDKYGGLIKVKQSTVTLIALNQTITKPNPERVELIITNTDDVALWIKFEYHHGLSQSFKLDAGGGSLKLTADEDSTLCTTGVYVQTGTSGKVISIIELIRETVEEV